MAVRYLVELIILLIIVAAGLILRRILSRRLRDIRDDGVILRKKECRGQIICIQNEEEEYEEI